MERVPIRCSVCGTARYEDEGDCPPLSHGLKSPSWGPGSWVPPDKWKDRDRDGSE